MLGNRGGEVSLTSIQESWYLGDYFAEVSYAVHAIVLLSTMCFRRLIERVPDGAERLGQG